MAKPFITLKDISVVYNKGEDNEVSALQNISLTIYPEEYIVLYGPSGCGKSTLLYTIAGLETPTQGSLVVAEKDLAELSDREMVRHHRETIGMVFQSFNLIASLTVLKNVLLPNVFLKKEKKEREQAASTLLKKFGVDVQAYKLPTELSGGQQQRVAIARSLINNPSIILADEPVGNLDSQAAATVMQLLADLNRKEKKTIILVTHDASYLRFAHRIFYMRDGKVYKEEVNQDRSQVAGETKNIVTKRLNSFDMLLQSYPEMSPLQMNVLMTPFKAKMMAHHLLSNYEEQQFYALQKLIEQRLSGSIDSAVFIRTLDDPQKKGGIELDKRTAKKFAAIVENIIHHANLLIVMHDAQEEQKSIERIGSYLLREVSISMVTEQQMQRLHALIKDRANDKTTKEEMKIKLDNPLKKGGAGFDRRSAQKIARILELLMLVKFGMVHTSSSSK